MARCFRCSERVGADPAKMPVIWPAKNPAQRRVAFCGVECWQAVVANAGQTEGGSHDNAG